MHFRDEIDKHLDDHHRGYLDYLNYLEWKMEKGEFDEVIDSAKDELMVTLEYIPKD